MPHDFISKRVGSGGKHPCPPQTTYRCKPPLTGRCRMRGRAWNKWRKALACRALHVS